MSKTKTNQPNQIPGMAVAKLRHLCRHFDLSDAGSKAILESRLRIHSVAFPLALCQLNTNHLCHQQVASCNTFLMRSVREPGTKLIFIYTAGFTKVGAREIIVNGIHSSLVKNTAVSLNGIFDRHIEGHPLLENHCVQSKNIIFAARYPDDSDGPENETALLQASKMTLPSHVYGPENYKILELVPILAANKKNPKQYNGEPNHPDFSTVNPAGLHACEKCGVLKCMGVKLLSCGRCKLVHYCSTAHQKADWKQHKPNCIKCVLDDEALDAKKKATNQAKAKIDRKNSKKKARQEAKRVKEAMMAEHAEEMTTPGVGTVTEPGFHKCTTVESEHLIFNYDMPRKFAELFYPPGKTIEYVLFEGHDEDDYDNHQQPTFALRMSEEFEREYSKTYDEVNYPDWCPYLRVELDVEDENGNDLKINVCVHQLVAQSFLGEQPSPGYFIRHKNGIMVDNSAVNLAWML